MRIGLYWSSVIKEMPRYEYDKHYGVLVMFPFMFSFVGFLILPCLASISDKKKLELINEWAFKIYYFPITLIVISIFMIVNLALVPIAYLKTVGHKLLLLKKYRSRDHLKNAVLFILLGIPLLLGS